MFEDIRAAFNAALDKAMGDARGSTSLMREAVIEAKSSVQMMRDDIQRTERELTAEKKSWEDAARRGKLADEIGDQETAGIAREFAAKHEKKATVLERKLEAQREELVLAEREVEDMVAKLKSSHGGSVGSSPTGGSFEAGGSAGAESHLRSEIDSSAKDALAEEQLRQLKRKMGK